MTKIGRMAKDNGLENCKKILGFELISPSLALWLDGYKEFYYNKEITVTTNCRMLLSKFPHDQQRCLFEVGSYGH